jgi:hypothetical protein
MPKTGQRTDATYSGVTAAFLFYRGSYGKEDDGRGCGRFRSHSHFERMEQERQGKAQARAEANKPKKVTLPRIKFLDQK